MSQSTPTRPASTPNSKVSVGAGFEIPAAIFDDLCSRFIINIPEEERQDLIRIFFQIELAHWFYLDFYCQENPELRACGIKDFSAQIFRHCPTLIVHADNVDKILESWRGYKMAVPTYGAIMIDPTFQNGFWSKVNWGFPKGKVNEDEEAHDCAIREVYEETGFDISELINKEAFLEFKLNEQLSRLYIITGVPMDTQFAPRTRKEIRKLDWFRIDHIPAHKKDIACKTHYGLPPNAFFMVIPFIKPLRKWIARYLNKTPDVGGGGDMPDATPTSHRMKHKSGTGDLEPLSHQQQQQQPQQQQQTPHARRQRSKSQCGDLVETTSASTPVSDKQRQKQKQFFQQQVQNEYLEYQSYNAKTPKPSRDQRTRSVSPSSQPPKGSAGRHLANSPKHKKHVAILKRDGTVAGTPPRKCLSAQFQNSGENTGHGRGKSSWKKKDNVLSSESWMNFTLDINAVMSVYVS